MSSKLDENNQKIGFVRFLHLSDFHFPDVNFEEGMSIDEERGLQSPQIAVLREVYKIIGKVDFIFISGDLTSNADLEGFDKCISFICDRFSHHDVRIYSVFGNHDLKRGGREKKFDQFLQIIEGYPSIHFGGPDVCKQMKLTKSKSLKIDLDLLFTNTCKNSSDNPIIPEKLKLCIIEPISSMYGDKIGESLWNQIKLKLEESTLIDDISFKDEDYETLNSNLKKLGTHICLSHHNLVSFSGVDELNSFFSDQGKFRDFFVNHEDTVIYLSGHTHTQECTIIENPNDDTNKLICITSPPFFKIKSSVTNGFNIIDLILRKNNDDSYEPIGCKIQKIDDDVMKGNVADCEKIRFSKNLRNLKLTTNEQKVINCLQKLTKKANGSVRIKKLLESLESSDFLEVEGFNIKYLHELLIYFWWVGIIDEYSAMMRENEFEVKLTDYIGVVSCVPMNN